MGRSWGQMGPNPAGDPRGPCECPTGGGLGVCAVTSSVGPPAAGASPPSMSISWESPQADPWPWQGEVAACRNPKAWRQCQQLLL